MKALVALCLSATLVGGSATAGVTPQPGAQDPRIRTVFYNPEEVVELRGYFGYQMMLQFGEDERIENVSIGNGLAWQVTPNKRATLLFVKPMDKASPTNMTVVTSLRRYAFELISSQPRPGRIPDMAYVVQFLYPPVYTPPTPLPPPRLPPEKKNTRYTYTGARTQLPSQVFDDGHFTYFQWLENVSTPALFMVAADGSESIVNYSVRDGYQVVEQTAPRFVLRNGKDVTYVINEGWREPSPGSLAPQPHDARTAKDAGREAPR